MRQFWNEAAEWSFKTFGSREVRGPLGPARHLKKEVEEVLVALQRCKDYPGEQDFTDDAAEELVDCAFLVFDTARRLGVDYDEFLTIAFDKLAKNKRREWPPTSSEDPVEHKRF